MRIAVADNTGKKFCQDLISHWEKKHEVRYERGASEHLAQWADLYYVDWSDNNIHYLRDLYEGDPRNCRTPDWDNNKRPKFVCRAIDWDVWIGHARDQSLVDWVDQWITIAPHIEQKLRAEANFGDKLKLIRPGVNLERFTPKTKRTDGFQLGMVLGDMWWPKNHLAGLDIFYQLYRSDQRWRLHIRGQHEPGEYWKVMYDHYLTSREIQQAVVLYDHVDDMNEWYENIDVLLHPGMKETFCYAVGEAAAKGIPCVINQFYGSEFIWPKGWLYRSHDQAVQKIIANKNQGNNLKGYRTYIEDNYPLERMLKEYDELLGT